MLEFPLIARTDARGTNYGSLDKAIGRANDFLDAGADITFVEEPTEESELERIGRNVDGPLVYNFVGEFCGLR